MVTCLCFAVFVFCFVFVLLTPLTGRGMLEVVLSMFPDVSQPCYSHPKSHAIFHQSSLYTNPLFKYPPHHVVSSSPCKYLYNPFMSQNSGQTVYLIFPVTKNCTYSVSHSRCPKNVVSHLAVETCKYVVSFLLCIRFGERKLTLLSVSFPIHLHLCSALYRPRLCSNLYIPCVLSVW